MYLLFLSNVVALVAYVIVIAPIVWVSRSYLDIYGNYDIIYFLFQNKLIFIRIFESINDPGGGGLYKNPFPLQSRQLLNQTSPYHTCVFY